MSDGVGVATASAVRRVLVVTLVLNLAVSFGKILVGWISGSLAMVADGYHSLVDGGNNIIGLVVASVAYAPPDRGHPYGHRKFETAATTVIGAALLLLAYELLTQAVSGVGHEQPQIGLLNWAVMMATMGVNLGVTLYEAREGQRLGSDYLVADSAHTRADLFVSAGVVASFAAVKLGFTWADSAVALVIAGIIAFQAVRILVGAFNVLTDRAAIAPERLTAAVEGVVGVVSLRESRTRGASAAVYVDLVISVDGDLALRAAHEVADRVEAHVKETFPGVVDVVVHLEPAE